MTIAQAESLKVEWTDKYVVVQQGVPELRRFAGWTGQVKTVNMSGRALVEFDGPVDISWYDIDPSYLKVVAKPEKKAAAHAPAAKAESAPAAAPKAKPAGKSPLEMARQQGAAKAEGAAPAKKLSPLEAARAQGAAKPAGASKGMSPLEAARAQGAAKPAAETPAPQPTPAAAPEPVVETEAPPATEAAAPPSASSGGLVTPGSTAEIIALARQQGPFKS